MDLELDQDATTPRGRALDWIGRFLCLVLLLALLVVLTGWVVGDVHGWSKWLSWVPAPILLALPLLGLVIGVISTGRFIKVARWLFLLLALFLFAWTFGVDWGIWRTKSVLPTDLVVVHWNATWPGKELELDVTYDAIGSVDPDLVVITEPGRFGWADIVKDFLSTWPYVTRSAGIVLLSREPVRSVRPIIASGGVTLVQVQLDLAGVERSLWVVDLPSDPSRSRPEIFDRLLTLAASKNTPAPDLLLGDLNVTRHSRSLARSFPDLVSCFDQAGSGWSGTWPRALPLWQLDQTMIGPAFECRHFEVLDPGYGRHRMPSAVLRPRPSPEDPASSD